MNEIEPKNKMNKKIVQKTMQQIFLQMRSDPSFVGHQQFSAISSISSSSISSEASAPIAPLLLR
jgi:hypothetical protein